MRTILQGLICRVVWLGIVMSVATLHSSQLHAQADVNASKTQLSRFASLYQERKLATLRDSLATWKGPVTPEIQYYHGALSYAFNDPETAIALLRPLFDHPAPTLTAQQNRDIADQLGRSYQLVFQYREAADVYRMALRRNGTRLDSATRSQFTRALTIAEALNHTPPQRVVWTAQARYDTLQNGGNPGSAQVLLNNALASVSFVVDPNTALTIVDSATASEYQVQKLASTVSLGTTNTQRTVARVGVVKTLRLGPAIVSNVVVLIVPSLDPYLSDTTHDAHGILGMSVLRTLGNVTFIRDGHVAISSPGVVSVRPDTLPSSSRMQQFADVFFDGDMPMIATAYDGARLRSNLSEILESPRFQNADGVTLDLVGMTLQLRNRAPPPLAVLPPIVPSATEAPHPTSKIPPDVAFIALLFALFVVPKALQRYRIPSAITSLLMGAAANAFGLFQHDPTLELLSTFGIVALFLFAGLEIDGSELRRHSTALIQHGVFWLLSVVLVIGIVVWGFDGSPRIGALIALALLTPSTGFILSSLAGFGLLEKEQFAVKTYAIGSELLALAGLFLVLQSTSFEQFFFALAAMIGVVIVIPLAFRLFAGLVAPHAPRSEFAFLLMTAVVCAYATRRLGVYYLVGAFLVGVAAQRFRSYLPAMSSEKMVDALESFGSVFVPFYFFRAGTHIVAGQLTPKAIGLGILLVAVFVPLRIGIVMLHRRFILKDETTTARRVGIALIPTLVFTLVLVEIMQARFGLADAVAGGLVLYTVVNTMVPAFALRGSAPEFEHVTALPMELFREEA